MCLVINGNRINKLVTWKLDAFTRQETVIFCFLQTRIKKVLKEYNSFFIKKRKKETNAGCQFSRVSIWGVILLPSL